MRDKYIRIKLIAGITSTATGYNLRMIVQSLSNPQHKINIERKLNSNSIKAFYKKSNSYQLHQWYCNVDFRQYSRMFLSEVEIG